jgi:hypothetical protein
MTETLDKARRGRRSGDLHVRTAPAQRTYKPRPRPVILKVVSWQKTDAAARRCAAYVLGKAIEQERAGHAAELAAYLGVPTEAVQAMLDSEQGELAAAALPPALHPPDDLDPDRATLRAELAHEEEMAAAVAGDHGTEPDETPAFPEHAPAPGQGEPTLTAPPLVELDPSVTGYGPAAPMPAGLDLDAELAGELALTVAGDLDGAAPVPAAPGHALDPDVGADGPAAAIDDLAAAGELDGPALSPERRSFPAPTPDRAALAAFQRDADLDAEMMAGIAGDLDNTSLPDVPRRPGLRFGDSIDRILELNPKGRRSCHMVVSVAGADPDTLRDITERFIAEQYPGHPYAAAMHTDTDHLHCHVILSRRNDLGQYTPIDRDQLALDRQVIAALAQEHGLNVEARGYWSPSRALNTHFQRGVHSLAHHAERIDKAAGEWMQDKERQAVAALASAPLRAGVAVTMAPAALAELAAHGPERAAAALKAAPGAMAELATAAGRKAGEHIGHAAGRVRDVVRAELAPAIEDVREAVQDARALTGALKEFVVARRSGERWNRRAIEATASAAATLDQIGDPRAAAVAHVAETAARSLGVSAPGIEPARTEPGQDRQTEESTYDRTQPQQPAHPPQPHHPVSRDPADAPGRSRGRER